jgi:hypothetical protein
VEISFSCVEMVFSNDKSREREYKIASCEKREAERWEGKRVRR